jgi:hypothetical protein
MLDYYIKDYMLKRKLTVLDSVDIVDGIRILDNSGNVQNINRLISIPTNKNNVVSKEDDCTINIDDFTTTCVDANNLEKLVKEILVNNVLTNEEKINKFHNITKDYFFIRIRQDNDTRGIAQTTQQLIDAYYLLLISENVPENTPATILGNLNTLYSTGLEATDSLEVYDDIPQASSNPILTIEQGNVKNEALEDVQNEKFLKNVQEKKKHLKQGNDKFNNDLKQFNEEMENKRKETQKEIDELNAEIVKANSTKDIEEEEIILQGKDKRKKR